MRTNRSPAASGMARGAKGDANNNSRTFSPPPAATKGPGPTARARRLPVILAANLKQATEPELIKRLRAALDRLADGERP